MPPALGTVGQVLSTGHLLCELSDHGFHIRYAGNPLQQMLRHLNT
jgi:hypothetical protein